MSFRDIWTLAFRNLKAGRKNVNKIIFGMSCACTLIYCFVAVIYYFNEYKESFEKNYQNSNYCFYEVEKGGNIENTVELIKEVSLHKEYCKAYETGIFLDICPSYSQECIYASDLVISINKTDYPINSYFISNREFYQNINGAYTRIDIGYYKDEFGVFPKKLYGNDYEIAYIGRLPSNPGEIMLDDHILKVYGIDVEQDKLIGANITLKSLNNNEEIICEDYVISGIYKAKDLVIREVKETHDYHLEHIYVNLKPEDENRFHICYGSSYRFYYNDYSDFIANYKYSDNILNMQTYANAYEDIDYLVTEKGMEIFVLSWFMNNVGKLLIILTFAVVLVIMFSLFYIIQFYFRRNANYMDMLNCIGMNRSDRRRLHDLEMLIMIIGAVICAVYISIVFFIVFKYITYKLLSIGFNLNVPVFLISILVSSFLIWVYKSIIVKK